MLASRFQNETISSACRLSKSQLVRRLLTKEDCHRMSGAPSFEVGTASLDRQKLFTRASGSLFDVNASRSHSFRAPARSSHVLTPVTHARSPSPHSYHFLRLFFLPFLLSALNASFNYAKLSLVRFVRSLNEECLLCASSNFYFAKSNFFVRFAQEKRCRHDRSRVWADSETAKRNAFCVRGWRRTRRASGMRSQS